MVDFSLHRLDYPGRTFFWQMLPEVADALEILGWVAPPGELLPEEVCLKRSFAEGAVYRVIINAYERNPAARKACIAHYGTCCVVCGFNFAKTYGDVGSGFIHIHHLRPISEIGAEYVVDPVADLRPVCANCHAVIHRRNPPYTIDEVRQFLAIRSMT